MDNTNVMITGVGGQGVVLASDILGDVAIACGFDVKKTDTLGMAQRGGSVVTNMRIGKKLFSPLISEGEVDLLLAFEKLEAVRWSSYLKMGAFVIVSDQRKAPPTVAAGAVNYPDDSQITRLLSSKQSQVIMVEGQKLSAELGNPKVLNVLMLGVLSMRLPFSLDKWKETLRNRLPAKIVDINMSAFERGREVKTL